MSTLIKRLTNFIRTKSKGEEVRGSIADGLDALDDRLDEAINNQLITVDPTLTITGAAADAKVVGDLIKQARVIKGVLPTNSVITDINETGTWLLSGGNTYIGLPEWIPYSTNAEKQRAAGWLTSSCFSTSQMIVYYSKNYGIITKYKTLDSWGDWKNSVDGITDVNVNKLSVGPSSGNNQNIVSGQKSAAIGELNTIEENNGFVNGYSNTVSDDAYYAHAEGGWCTAGAEAAHAEGLHTSALGIASHSEGLGTIARGTAQFVRGKYNKEDTAGLYVEIVGDGSSDNSRSNLYTLGNDGTIETRGNLKLAKELFNVSTDAYTINSKKTYIWSDGYFNQNNAWVVADGEKLWCCSQVLPINSNKIALTRTAIVHHAYFQMFGFNPFTAEDITVSLANYGVAISGAPNIGDRVVIGKRKPNRTATGVPVTDYIFYAESDNQNLNITFVDTGTLTENYYQFVYRTVNNVTGWYDEYSHLYFIGDYYSDTTARVYIDRQHFNVSNNVKYIRIFAVYQDTVNGATIDLRKLAQVQAVSSVFKIDSEVSNNKTVGAMITFIDDDTSSKTLVKQYHDLFDRSHYSNVPTTYHMAGCYAVEAYRLIENPTLTRMTLTASASTSVLGEVEESYVPPYDAQEAGPILLEQLKEYEEQGFEMLYHCMYQLGRATNAHNTAYIIDGYQRNEDNLNLIRHNIITGIRTIEGLGLANWRKHWVTPYGADDKYVQSIARSLGFESLIRTVNGLISRDIYTDRYSIPRFGYDYGYADGRGTPEALKKVIDRAVATNSWVIIMSHVNAWGSDVEQYTNGFHEIVQHCIDRGAEIVSYSDGFERYKKTLLDYEKLS